MTITSPLHSFFRALTARSRAASHPEALQERHLNIPRRIDDPATAARLARELLHSRREDITLAFIWTILTASSVTQSSQRAGFKPLAFRQSRSLPGLKLVEQPDALSSATAATAATAATGSPAPRK